MSPRDGTRGGRPPIGPEVKTRLNKSEADRLQDDADWTGVDRSEMLRRIVKQHQDADPFPVGRRPVMLKLIDTARYEPNVPDTDRAQTDPDGVWYDLVAHLPSMQRASVVRWVRDRTTLTGVRVMVAFAAGTEMGQVPGLDLVRQITIPDDDMDEVRRLSRLEHAKVMRARGRRTDHLVPIGSDWWTGPDLTPHE